MNLAIVSKDRASTSWRLSGNARKYGVGGERLWSKGPGSETLERDLLLGAVKK